MTLPVILVDSATGSDTAASGAGPSTALTGSAGITSADGLTVVLDGSPDLTNVATDGSHVIFMSDTNAGSRNFGKITAKANSGTPTAEVTVANAFQALNTDAWATGGKRASIGSTTSSKLVNNNGGSGDALAGWAVEFQNAHTETISGPLNVYVTGDMTSGAFTMRGVGSTYPIITFDNNSGGFIVRRMRNVFEHLEGRNTNGTKTSSSFISFDDHLGVARDIKVTHATNNFAFGIAGSGGSGGGQTAVYECEIANQALDGLSFSSELAARVECCYLHDNGRDGVRFSAVRYAGSVYGCIIYNNVGKGVYLTGGGTDSGVGAAICHNTVDANDSDGIAIDNEVQLRGTKIENNIFSNNGGYGLNLSSLPSASLADGDQLTVRNNDTYNNTSGASSPASVSSDDPGLNPTYANAASGDFSIGTNLKAKGYPIGGTQYVGNTSTTYSYADIGAAQREEAGGGGFYPIVRKKMMW